MGPCVLWIGKVWFHLNIRHLFQAGLTSWLDCPWHRWTSGSCPHCLQSAGGLSPASSCPWSLGWRHGDPNSDTDAIIPSFLMWTRGAVILRVMSVRVVTLTRSLLLHSNLMYGCFRSDLCFNLRMNMSRKLMKANSMSAVNTDIKQMMMKTSRAVA